MRKTLVALITLVSLVALLGCDLEEFAGTSKFKEDFEYTYDLEPGGRLSVETMNGSVEIFGWDKPEVQVIGTKYAATRSLLDSLEIDIVASDNAVRIRTVKASGRRRGNMGARYTIHAPRRIELERIQSSNGSIHVEGVDGAARLRTSNGRVRVVEFQGDVEATTSNGSVQLNEHRGSAVVRTSNGGVRADGIRGHFEAKTSNASVTARILEVDPGRPMRVSTSNGSVNLTLEDRLSGDVVASTSNGSITIKAPPSLSARLKAHTSNSSISTDFDVMVRGGVQKKTRLEGEIGGGGPLLDLRTSNGNVRLKKLAGEAPI